MNETTPQSPEQIRGETLTPVSPKPIHYPSPSNIPFLGASVDPNFNDTVTETMQEQSEPLPSTAQHTIPIIPPPDATMLDAASIPEDDQIAPVAEAESIPELSNEQDALEQQMDMAAAVEPAHNTASSDPADALPTTESIALEPAQDSVAVDTLPTPAVEPIDVAATEPAQLLSPTSADTSILAQKLIDTPNPDYASLLAKLSHVMPGATPAGSSTTNPASAQPPSAVASQPSSALPTNPNLPPKPPAQEKPSNLPHFPPGSDPRNYHPHNDSGASVPTSTLPNLNTNGLPPPSHAYQHPHSATAQAATSAVGQYSSAAQDDEDAPFDPPIQALYDQFIQFERQNVHDGQWDKFPMGSRLFVGNLSTEKVQKRDVFRKFYKYGQLAQISLKQAYGFVQFMDATACATALASEQATKIRGREIHLEVSKPAKSTNRQQQDRNRRRSRSPDYLRGGGSRVDRYSGSPRDRDNRRSRDDWRRSPSPRRYSGGRDDRYDGRRRRSPSPYGARDSYRAPPRDELDLPWRAPETVPDVQILIVDQIDQ